MLECGDLGLLACEDVGMLTVGVLRGGSVGMLGCVHVGMRECGRAPRGYLLTFLCFCGTRRNT